MATVNAGFVAHDRRKSWSSKDLVIHLPFDRSTEIENCTPRRREDEYVRAQLVKIVANAGEIRSIKHMRSALFSGPELLALITKYPRRSMWRNGNLWRMLNLAVNQNKDNTKSL